MQYVIWSEEHGAWWGADETNLNYTRWLLKARRYPQAEAERIVFDANAFLEVGKLNEVAIPDPLAEQETLRTMQQRMELHFHPEARALIMLITGALAHEPDEHQVKALVEALVAAYRLGYEEDAGEEP